MEILRTNDVIELTGLSRSTLWRLEQLGQFPKRIHLASNSVGWLKSDIENWIETRPRGIASTDKTVIN